MAEYSGPLTGVIRQLSSIIGQLTVGLEGEPLRLIKFCFVGIWSVID